MFCERLLDQTGRCSGDAGMLVFRARTYVLLCRSFDDDGSMPSSLQGLACIYNDAFVTPLWPRPQE